MSYSVHFSASAKRDVFRLPHAVQDRVEAKIRPLAENPRPHGYVKLAGSGYCRVRVGDYRILYEVNDAERRIVVLAVGHRREIYRRIPRSGP